MKLIDRLFSEEVSGLWNEWEVRAVILLSLLFQIILILFGSQRKYRKGSWIKIVVWSTYMAADWVATVALGNLAKIQANSEKYSSKQYNIGLQAFWAPFLLLHLGGPDTITAYSLEDNELWKRHFLGLVVEVGVAIYVFFRSFNNSALTYMFIPIFVAGIIKYGERTYALMAASNSQLKEYLVSTSTTVENEMRIAMGIKEEDLFEMELMEEPIVTSYEGTLRGKHFVNNIEEAHFFFKRLEYLFANMILPFNDRIECCNILMKKSYGEAFELIEIELGFLYDVLYTKGKIIHTRAGFFIRIISFFSTVSALIFFTTVIDLHVYSRTDISITLLLLLGAVFLEVYAFIVFLFSDWTKISSVKKQIPKITYFCKSSFTKKRWSKSVAQYNLVDFAFAKIQSGKFINGVRKLPYIRKWIDEYQKLSVLSWRAVNDNMLEMIFHQLKYKAEKIKDNYTMKSCKELLAQRGDLREKFEIFDRFSWSTINLEFDHSLLVWHIATDICYYSDSVEHIGHDGHQNHEISKYLSDYMLYLLFQCPSMLPKGIGKIRYKDTCGQVLNFLKKKVEENCDVKGVRKMMLDREISERHITQSILSDGCKLAKELQQLESDQESNHGSTVECKWNMISEVWVEMLIYAASHCGWREHGQQLWKGGELLTHVCVLMTHLGLSEQYNEKGIYYLV